MAVLKPLTEEVISHLRTGVTATSVTQCVEELVLNSIDAGAKCIAVRVDFSCWKIQVVDNGCGILVDQLEQIAERYNTSKCHLVEDLDNLKYFGYRGEALSSIRDASSVLEIVTRTKHSSQTYCRLFQKGSALKVAESKTCRPSTGTTITAYELFYNLPVRRKCVNVGLEFEKIRQRVEGIALINPQISFSLRNDITGTVVIQTHKSNNSLGAFTYLFGVNRARYLSEIYHAFDKFEITGYISKEGYCKKDLQFLYLNGRLVLKTKIHKIINKILGKYCFGRKKYVQESPGLRDTSSPSVSSSPTKHTEKHAVFILDIKCPYNSYDITFDPAKTVVEFKDWETLVNQIETLVREFLKKEGIIITADDKLKDDILVDNKVSKEKEQPTNLVQEDEIILLSDEQKYAKSISSFDVINSLVSKTAHRINCRNKDMTAKNSYSSDNDLKNGNSTVEHICSEKTAGASTDIQIKTAVVKCTCESPLQDIDNEKQFAATLDKATIPFSSEELTDQVSSKCRALSCTSKSNLVVSDEKSNEEASTSNHIVNDKIQTEGKTKILEDVSKEGKQRAGSGFPNLSSSFEGMPTTVISETTLSDVSTWVSGQSLSLSDINPLGCSTPLSNLSKSPTTPLTSSLSESFSYVDSATSFLSEDPLYITSEVYSSNEAPLPPKFGNRTFNESAEMDSGIGDESNGGKNTNYSDVTSKPITLPRGEISILSQFRKRKFEDDLIFTRNSSDSISRRLNEIHSVSMNNASTFKKPNIFNKTKPPQTLLKETLVSKSCTSSCECLRNLGNDVHHSSNCFNSQNTKKNGHDSSLKNKSSEINSFVPTSVSNNKPDSKEQCDSFHEKSVSNCTNMPECTCGMKPLKKEKTAICSQCQSGMKKSDPMDLPFSRLCCSADFNSVKSSNLNKSDLYNKLYINDSDCCSTDTCRGRSCADLCHCVKKQQLTKVQSCSEFKSSVTSSSSKHMCSHVQDARHSDLTGKESVLPQTLTKAAKLAKRMRDGKEYPTSEQEKFLTSASFIQTPSSILKQLNSHTNDMKTSNSAKQLDNRGNMLSNTLLDIKKTKTKSAANSVLVDVYNPQANHCSKENIDADDSCDNRFDNEMQQNPPIDESQLYLTNTNEFSLEKKVFTSRDLDKQSVMELDMSDPSESTAGGSISLVSNNMYCDIESGLSGSGVLSGIVDASTLFHNFTAGCCEPTILLEHTSDLNRQTIAPQTETLCQFSNSIAQSDKETQEFLAASQGFQTDDPNKNDMSLNNSECENDNDLVELSPRKPQDSFEPSNTECFQNHPSISSFSVTCNDFKQDDTEMQIETDIINVPKDQTDPLHLIIKESDTHNNTNGTVNISCSGEYEENSTSHLANELHPQTNDSQSDGHNIQSFQKMDNATGDAGAKLDVQDSSCGREHRGDETNVSQVDNNWIQMSKSKTGEAFYIHKISGHTVPIQKWPSIQNTDQSDKEDIQPIHQLSRSFKSTFSHLSGKISKLDKHQSQSSNSTFRSWLGSSNSLLLDYSDIQANNSGILSDNTDYPWSGNVRERESQGTSSSGDPLLSLFSGRNDTYLETTTKGSVTSCTPDTEIEDEDSAAKIIDSWENPVFNRPELAVEAVPDTCENNRLIEKTLRSMHPVKFTKDMLQNIQVVGQIDNKFIACILHQNSVNSASIEKVLVFIDQHAAHERIRLEKLKKGSFINGDDSEILRSSAVVPPELLSLPADEVRIMHSYRDEFHRIGLNFREKDRNSIEVLSIPACIVEREASEFRHKRESTVLDIVQALIGEHAEVLMSTCGARQLLPKTIHRLLCSQACRGAIKFGDKLSFKECEELLEALSACDMPFQCAHGRPSLIPILELKRLDDKSAKKNQTRPRIWKLKFS